MEIIQSIQNKIYEIRGERIMPDKDLAFLYEVETKALSLSVKRNIKRFPPDCMFQLTKDENESLMFQNTEFNRKDPLRFQIETSKGRGGTRYLPYAFTEQGVAMLRGVIHSDKTISMNIAIMRAFIPIKKILLQQSDMK